MRLEKYQDHEEIKETSFSKFIERFSIECRNNKTKGITTANQNKGKYHKEPIRPKVNTCNGLKHEKTRVTKSLLVLVLHLIG